MSEDSNMGSLTDPMSLNRYVYARDNPMTLVDPSGKVYTDEQAYGDTNACTTADCSLTQAQMDANNAAMVGETMYDPVGTTSTTDYTDVNKVSYTPSPVGTGTKSSDVTLTTGGVNQYSSTAGSETGTQTSQSAADLVAAYALAAGLITLSLQYWSNLELQASIAIFNPALAFSIDTGFIIADRAVLTYMSAHSTDATYEGVVNAFLTGFGSGFTLQFIISL